MTGGQEHDGEQWDPERWDADTKRASEIVTLTDRFGEWYRIGWSWESRMFWAERDGDKLFGDSAGALTMIICDHMALLRDQGRQRPTAMF